MAVNEKIVGRALTSEKDKELTVELDGDRLVALRIGKEGVRLDRQSLPAILHALQAASLEVV